MLINTSTMVDWNWFFAAFAQCGAALIGIIAAFIISKLLAEDNKYDSIKIKLESVPPGAAETKPISNTSGTRQICV
ncbi:hypothetical protein H206_03730, partial [Candidatus Electrothrix aarhusensis]